MDCSNEDINQCQEYATLIGDRKLWREMTLKIDPKLKVVVEMARRIMMMNIKDLFVIYDFCIFVCYFLSGIGFT